MRTRNHIGARVQQPVTSSPDEA